MKNAHDYARNMAVELLKGSGVITEPVIRAAVQGVIQATKALPLAGVVDEETLVSELLHLFSITIGKASALDDIRGHKAWLDARRAEIKWSFWRRYSRYLETDLKWAPQMVESLDRDTDMVLGRVEDPNRDGCWDRRGMVVGSVQSGKTANYAGLINKAIDAGYKLIIVLAGTHDSLRSQTQIRIDEGVLGFDTQKNLRLDQSSRLVGVGKIPTQDLLVIHSLTSRLEKGGDFNARQNATVMLRGAPVVLVVKKSTKKGKNGRADSGPLGNLLRWILDVAGTPDPTSGGKIVKDVPLLLIDDEADNASINTKAGNDDVDGEDSVSAINGKIRELLSCFEKAAYVGYTATPFANIFINPDSKTEKHEDDVFPRSFIINVKAPSNYVGPTKVFGLDGDEDASIDAADGLAVIRDAADGLAVESFPPRHKKDHVPTVLPDSLRKAIRAFLLAAAARHARGQGAKHCSMLIHVTRFVDVQNRVAALVADELKSLVNRIANGDGARTPTLLNELKALWQSDFEPTSLSLGAEAGRKLSWAEVAQSLYPASSKITVATVNGFAKEALDYKEHEAVGRSVIAIGGDKLSRGLTLEGLTVSYFLRTTRMYDTLMQMGRWFGYRPGYLDLCRLYTTSELVEWYRHIALAEVELRREFDYMVHAGLTPENYGLRVRTHPGGMIVTALNKMGWNQRVELSCAGTLVQTARLPKDERLSRNAARTDAFLSSLPAPPAIVPPPPREGRALVWRDIGPDAVADYLAGQEYPTSSMRMAGVDLAAFIRKQNQQGELVAWTVALMTNSQTAESERRDFAGRRLGLLRRNPARGSQTKADYALRKANILSPRDQSLDLADFAFTPELAASLAAKPGFTAEERNWLGDEATRAETRSLDQVAVALARRRALAKGGEAAAKAEQIEFAPGEIARELRPKTHGLLLIYPLEQPGKVPALLDQSGVEIGPREETGLDPAGPPVIGLALSFPSSETAARIEYQVNKRWNPDLVEDDANDD
jgi:hypothetical protein